MKKEFKKGEFAGYAIGESISIHSHINDPESWFVTIRPMQIFGQILCSKERTEAEIRVVVMKLLNDKYNIVWKLMDEVNSDPN